jgi:TonB-dependent starch-binding outer membrane protein SusC
MDHFRWLIAILVAVATVPAALDAQQRGTVTGTVVNAATQRPLVGVQVTVAGTQLGTLTNQQGRYTITNVPVGSQQIRANIIGFSQETAPVAVAVGEIATVNFQLRETAVMLEGLVVTATGETQRRREVGNAVGNINVAQDVELAAVGSAAQLLQARAPGVSVNMTGGTTGSSQRIRIRGSNSVSLSNEPLLIIDGVRINNSAQSMSIAVGGQDISRMNDLNPEDIESIEILKGPAAAAMYGTAAANGVIQITTRRGRVGAPRWSAYSEFGTLEDVQEYPGNWGRFGFIRTSPTQEPVTNTRQCTLYNIATGSCQPMADTLLYHHPINAVQPFRTGSRTKFGLNVAGGGDVASYFISGDREEEQGIFANNWLERTNLRANVTTRLRDDLDATVSAGFVSSNIALPFNDNSLFGQMGGSLLGLPVTGNVDAAGQPLEGYAGTHPRRMEQVTTGQDVRRFTGGLTANYRPLEWLNIVHQSGIDGVFRHDHQTVPINMIANNALNASGSRSSNRAEIINVNASLGGTANFQLTDAVSSMTSVGTQYQRELFQRTDASGSQLLPGTERLPGTSALFAVSEIFTDNRTIGGYLQQQFGWNDRLFVTGAMRGDDNSAFGADFGLVVYPSVSASWVVAEEPWFPQTDALSSLRLRTAYGSSGLRPSFRDALTFYTPVGATVGGTDSPAFTPGGIGDPNLRPEFTTELELGFDVGLFDDRVGAEFTFFNKQSRDALVFRRLDPSVGAVGHVVTAPGLGTGATGRFENIGRVSNRGIEALLRLQPVNTANFRWDLTSTYSTVRNRLDELAEGIEPIIFGLGGATQRHTPGYALGGYWGRRLVSWGDANDDGIIQPNEIQLSDAPEFLGSPMPTREYSFNTTATMFNLVRFSMLLDGKGGHMLNNSTRYFRCASSFVNCREAFDPTAPLEDQALAIAASGPTGERLVYLEDASFLKLRELAVTFIAPQNLQRQLRMEGLSLTLAGRNLHTWTNYTGFDPEVNFAGGDNYSTADFLTQPPVRYLTARINVNF